MLKLKITGRVQGVWYRSSTCKIALRLDLKGYAKNLPDNSVKVVVVGSEENLLKLKEWCAAGSSNAVVEKIEEEWSNAEETFEDFLVL